MTGSADTLQAKAAEIAKETAAAVKLYGNGIALLYYAHQLLKMPVSASQDTANKGPINEKEAAKIDQAMKDALLKWEYATERDKAKAMEIEKMVQEGQEKIKALYAN